MALVEDGSVDIAIVHDWLEMPLVLSAGLDARHLGNDISDVLVHVTHHLADRGSVAMAELCTEVWLYEPGSVAHDLLIQSFTGTRLFGHGVAEYASQIAMVGAGLGVALVPRMGRGAVPDTVRVLPVEPAPTRQVYAVWRATTGTRPALQAAVLALEESFSGAIDPSRGWLRYGCRCDRAALGPAALRSVTTCWVVPVYQWFPRLEKGEVAEEKVHQRPLFSVARVEAECGLIRTLPRSHSGESAASGSDSATSSTAPRMVR